MVGYLIFLKIKIGRKGTLFFAYMQIKIEKIALSSDFSNFSH